MLINPKLDFKNIIDQLKSKKIVVVDNFFKNNTCAFLRLRMQHGKKFEDIYPDYKANNYNCKNDEITNQIVLDLKENLQLINFQRAWSFIYNNKAFGVDFHADPSLLNINIWVTPNECISDFNKNGLIICDKKPPETMKESEWNGNLGNKTYEFLEKEKANFINIPYLYNRAIFFDGALFHKTNNVETKEGNENKRVSYTMLFGTQLQ